MHVLGTVVMRALRLRRTMARVRRSQTAKKMQRKTLTRLLKRSKNTAFGRAYGFEEILQASRPEELFRARVPISDYESIYRDWWHRSLKEEANICWPGKVKYFALSSGTSGASSKYIPVTQSMIKSMRKTSIRQLLSLINYNLPEEFFGKGVLVLGGTSDLTKVGNYYQGDLSGINQAKMPFYTAPFYKPGRHIARVRDWNVKIEEIVKKAPQWDIAMLTGVPAWNQLVLERIIETYKLRNIHEIWPNLSVFIYGGVALAPYKKSFDALLGKPIHYIQTYLASEGFIAFQSRKDAEGMELVLNNGIFCEFIPFNSKNFDPEGTLIDQAEALTIDEVQTGIDYALVLSTNSGAWRYLIGDTIRFTDVPSREIMITGRTKQFLSLCGEHVSQDNMNKAIAMVCEKFNLRIPEFTVAGTESGTLFAHHWYLGIEKTDAHSANNIQVFLDEALKELNDDYKVERQHALKEIKVELIPLPWFYEWMAQNGKLGGQHKFPRVLNPQRLEAWKSYLSTRKNQQNTV